METTLLVVDATLSSSSLQLRQLALLHKSHGDDLFRLKDFASAMGITKRRWESFRPRVVSPWADRASRGGRDGRRWRRWIAWSERRKRSGEQNNTKKKNKKEEDEER